MIKTLRNLFQWNMFGLTLQILGFCLLFMSPNAYAEEETPPIRVELISEDSSIQPDHPFWVGIHIKLQEGWHSYWKNPGDAGMPTAVTWELPQGLTASSIIWPTPEKFTNESLTGYGYHDEVLLLTQITPSKDLISLDPSMQLKANVQWLVCSDAFCIPGDSDIALDLPINRAAPQKNQQYADLFANARALLPEKMINVQASFDGKSIELHLPISKENANNAENVLFFPENQEVIDPLTAAVVDPDSGPEFYDVVLKPAKEEGVSNLKGVIAFTTGSGDSLKIAKAFEIDTVVLNEAGYEGKIAMATISSDRPFPILPDEPPIGFGTALVLAFLGGLILNLMPCVLPVISFKFLGFVKMAGECRASLFKHGLSFSSGVLVSFWILAGILLLLQTYGHAVGWGFQLQEPLFVAFLAAFLFAFACSLFGVYEVGNKVTKLAGKAQTHASKRDGHVSSFLSGVLATTVATPCTGPFLGTVVGLAITLSPTLAMLLFTSMGVGMAFPYLLLGIFPGFLRFLPKPGAWMDTFKQLMGFIMLATVIWLTWVFGAQTDNTALTLLLISFFLLALGCWIFGKWGSSVRKIGSRLAGVIFTALCFAVAGYLILNAASSGNKEANANEIVWEHYSPAKVEELQKQGKPILIDFTAKWCLTCQANRIALTSEDVERKITSLGIVTMEADWTKNDPVITQALRKYGRNGVPLYLLFTGTPGETPTILPQVLTPSVVLEYLDAMEK